MNQLFILFLSSLVFINAQVYNGYTLFTPMSAFDDNATTYLMNNDYEFLNTWTHDQGPASMPYLLQDSSIIYPYRVPFPTMSAGGVGGGIQKQSWDGEILWEYEFANEQYQHHHDVEPLPNGNILIIVWEKKTAQEAYDMGRETIDNPLNVMWSTALLELEPESGEIVWEKTKNFQLFGALFVNEWRPEWTFDNKNRNWFGYQIGLIGKNILSENDKVRLEYTWTDHRVYRHRFNINDSYSYDYSIGFWAGPHAEELFLAYNSQFKGIDMTTSFSHLKRGELTENMLVGQYDNINYERFSGKTESRNVASIEGTKGIFTNMVFIRLGCDWIDWTNPGFNPYNPRRVSGKDFSKFSLNIGITAKTTFSLD